MNKVSSIGNLIAGTGTTVNAYGFTGEQQFNEADNLVFLRARYYDSKMGRFISRDPILSPMRVGNNFVWFLPYLNLIYRPQSLHPYVYAQNNPIRNRDPFGLLTCEKRCELRYRIAVGVCGSNFIASCLNANPFGWIGWMICMEKARYKHIDCMVDCVGE